MNYYKKITKNELIQILDDYPDDFLFVMMMDFDNGSTGVSDVGSVVKKQKIKNMADMFKTLIFSGNKDVSQLDLYSCKFDNIFNISPVGMLTTVLLDGKIVAT